MSGLLLLGIVVVVGVILYNKWKEIEIESTQPPTKLSIEPIIESVPTEVIPPVQEKVTTITSQITDAVTTKKPRKPRTSKNKDAGDK